MQSSSSLLPSAAARPAAAHHALTSALEIRPLGGALGAEVVGLRLDQPLDADDFARLHRAHLDHHLLIFRDLDITPEQQIAFSRRFGPLQIHVLHQFHLANHPEILIVSNIVENGAPVGLGDAGHFWHSDLSYKETPSLGSMLYAQELPAEGGDTLFANEHLAWDTLPAALRKATEGRRAEHTYLARYAELQARSPWRPNLSAEQRAQVLPVEHPIVRVHPETGRRALFVSEHFTTRIVGLPEDESRAILDALFAHNRQEAFQYRHVWRAGDMVFWDNRSLQHLATGCPESQRRRLHRTTIEGDAPF
ncbi:MAG: TauD/TfdA dioxygenase family protein [Janthinobacterium lividum]